MLVLAEGDVAQVNHLSCAWGGERRRGASVPRRIRTLRARSENLPLDRSGNVLYEEDKTQWP